MIFSGATLASAAPQNQISSGFKFQKEGHELVVFGSSSYIAPGEKYKKVIIFSGNIDFHGYTDEFILFAGQVHFAKESVVKNSLVVLGGSFERDNGAQIANDKVEFRAPSFIYRLLGTLLGVAGDFFQGAIRWAGLFIFTLFLWCFGLLFQLLFPKFFADAEKLVFSFPFNVLSAAIGLFAFLPGILFLALTIIGIALIPIYIVVYLASFLFAYVLLAARMGDLAKRWWKARSAWALLFGLSVLQVIWLIWPSITTPLILLVIITWGGLLRSVKARF